MYKDLTARDLHPIILTNNNFDPQLECTKTIKNPNNIISPNLTCDPYDISKSTNTSYVKPIHHRNQLNLYENEIADIIKNKQTTNDTYNKIDYNTKYDISQRVKLNEYSIANLLDSNVDNIKINNITEYTIFITSNDRDFHKYPNPFSYQVKFNPITNSFDASIPIKFDNIIQIRLQMCILPRRYYMINDVYSIYISSQTIIENIINNLKTNDQVLYYKKNYIKFSYNTNPNITYYSIIYEIWNINTNDQLFIITNKITTEVPTNTSTYIIRDSIVPIFYSYLSNNIVPITIIETGTIITNFFTIIDNIKIESINIIYKDSSNNNYSIIYKKIYNPINDQFREYISSYTYDLIHIIDNTPINSTFNYKNKTFTVINKTNNVEFQIKFCPTNNNLNELIDECFEINLDINMNIISNPLPIINHYSITNHQLETFPYLLFNVNELIDTTDFSTNDKVRNATSILYPDFVNNDYLYIKTSLNEINYKSTKLGLLNNLTIKFQDYQGNQLPASPYFDTNISTNKYCICKQNNNGIYERNYLCSHSYFRHPFFEKFQNKLIFKVKRYETEHIIKPYN
jgi:hypothetical protein